MDRQDEEGIQILAVEGILEEKEMEIIKYSVEVLIFRMEI